MNQPTTLPRVIGFWTATAVVAGTIIGSGVFKKPAAVAAAVPAFGPAMLVWVGGAVLAVLGALVLAEVAVLVPRAGGNYAFLREGFGRAFGFLWGWVEFWIIRSGSIAALATIFAESLCEFLELVALPEGHRVAYWPRQFLTAGVIVGLAGVNIRGVKWGGALQVVVTVVKIGSMIVIAAFPFLAMLWTEPKPHPPTVNGFGVVGSGLISTAPVLSNSWSVTGFYAALIGVIWAYHGWMNIAPIAGEVSRPQRNLPLAMLVGVAIVTALYLGANVAYYQTLTSMEMRTLSKTTSVLAECCRRWFGPWGSAAAAAVLMTSVFGSLNGNVLVGPRLLFAMGEDRLAPAFLQRLHPNWKTPWLAIAVLAGWSAILVLGVGAVLKFAGLEEKKGAFDTITDFAMFGAVAFETLAVLAIYPLRRKLANVDAAYRSPLYPILPAVYGLLMLGVLINFFISKTMESITAVGIIAVGVGVYALIARAQRSSRPA